MYRKLTTLLYFLIITSSLFTQNSVRLFENCNYIGSSFILEPGAYRLYQMKIGNDRLSSFKIPSNLKLTIYEHDGFSGRSKTFYNDISCLEPQWNNMASSFVIDYVNSQTGSNEYVSFYRDCYSQGPYLKLGTGTYSGVQLGNLRYNISSFTISGNLQIKAYINNPNFSGYSIVYNENENCLPSNQDDKIGSLIIEELPANSPGNGAEDFVIFFSDCNYQGNGIMLQPGTYTGNQLGLMRNNIESIQVPPGLKIRTYINTDNLMGQNVTITENISCLNSNLRNRIGSLIIEQSYDDWNNNNGNPTSDGVVIYDLEDFKGESAILTPGSYSTMNQAGFLDNALSSLVLPQGYRVVLYEEENFKGESYTIYRTKSRFYFSGWSDKTSSIIVYKD